MISFFCNVNMNNFLIFGIKYMFYAIIVSFSHILCFENIKMIAKSSTVEAHITCDPTECRLLDFNKALYALSGGNSLFHQGFIPFFSLTRHSYPSSQV